MHLTRTIWLGLSLLATGLTGCSKRVAILDGGHFHPTGAEIVPRDSESYVLDSPCYVIPEETFRALMEP